MPYTRTGYHNTTSSSRNISLPFLCHKNCRFLRRKVFEESQELYRACLSYTIALNEPLYNKKIKSGKRDRNLKNVESKFEKDFKQQIE